MDTDYLRRPYVESTDGLCRRRVVQAVLTIGAGGVLIPGSGAASQPLQSGDADRTWIRVALTGRTAEGVDFAGESNASVAAAVAEELDGTDDIDVIARQGSEDDDGTVEVVDPDITVDQLGSALDAVGYSYDEIHEGVTQQTRDEAIGAIQTRLTAAGIEEYTVQQGRDDSGFVLVIGLPGGDVEDSETLIGSRGVVRIDIYHDEQGEYVTDKGALTSNDFQSVGAATDDDRIGPHVPVTVRVDAAERFQQQLVDTGVAQSGGSRCTYDQDPQNTEPCLLVVDDSEVVTAFGMAASLADSMQSGEWARSPSFVLTTSSLEEAQSIAINLRSGPLPAPVEFSTSDEMPVDESTLEDREIALDESLQSDDSSTDVGTESDDSSTDIEAPGFGVGTAIAGVGAAGALLRRLGTSERT